MSTRFCFLAPFLLVSLESFSQSVIADSASVARATSSLRENYYQKKRAESFISIGSDYSEYEPTKDEHPFFLDSDWILGTVKYNGIIYLNTPLQYDIRSQKLITEHVATGKKIELIREHVSWFEIQNHHFEFLNSGTPAGYYELMADGDAKLWATHDKKFQESTVTGTLTVRTDEETKYFIENKKIFSLVKGKSGVLAAFESKREQLKKELKRNRVNFNRDKPAGLIRAVGLYNSIR